MAVAQSGWSADGNWFWDGAQWNDAISQDGQWRFDGKDWQRFAGQRTPMPPQPPSSATPPPPPAPPGETGASALPSWVDASEIQRMESQKIERRLAEMTPEVALPPEQDWRLVGERMQYSDYSHNKSEYAAWRVGVWSVLIYLFLLWFCGVFSLIYVWMTGWKTTTKTVLTGLSILWAILGIIVLLNRYPQLSGG